MSAEAKREVKLGQVWRKLDPSGTTTMDFEVIGFQNGFHGIRTMVQGCTPSGRRLLMSIRKLSEGKGYEFVSETAAKPFVRQPRSKHRAKTWRCPPGTAVLVQLEDGSQVASRTVSRSYDVRGFGYVDVDHGIGAVRLMYVRVDRDRKLGDAAERVLAEVARATAKGMAYTSDPRTREVLRRPRIAALVTRTEGDRFLAKPEAFALLDLDPKTGERIVAAPTRRAS